jgi:hypothetical protein
VLVKVGGELTPFVGPINPAPGFPPSGFVIFCGPRRSKLIPPPLPVCGGILAVVLCGGTWLAGRTGWELLEPLVVLLPPVTGIFGVGLVVGCFAVLKFPKIALLGSVNVGFAGSACAAVFPPPDC